MKLAAHGIAAQLPAGWEGTISAEQQDVVEAQMHAFGTVQRPPEVLPVAQFATFGLPAVRNDFGGDEVAAMGADDVFVSLLEYAPQEAGSALFADRGLPWRLDASAFSPRMLHRAVHGRTGLQRFFNEGGRAFCLYVVLGSIAHTERLARRAEQLLATVQIEDRT